MPPRMSPRRPDEAVGSGAASRVRQWRVGTAVVGGGDAVTRGRGTGMDEKRRILVVDDEVSVRELVRIRREREGFAVSVAEDGRAALAMLPEVRPEPIITDMMMPRLDGIGLVKRLRENPETAGLPILMLTARDRGPDRTLGLDAGADDDRGKPFDVPELVSRVNARWRRVQVAAPAAASAPQGRGQVVAFVGAKGGERDDDDRAERGGGVGMRRSVDDPGRSASTTGDDRPSVEPGAAAAARPVAPGEAGGADRPDDRGHAAAPRERAATAARSAQPGAAPG